MKLTPRWVRFMSDAGHEGVHWSAVGSPAAADREICAYARRHGYVLITSDLDFPQILASTAEAGPSVILMRGEPLTPERRATTLLRAIDDCASELAAGAVLSIDWSGKPRARLLPMR